MAQFPLKMNGAEVCTIEDLKKNFNPADLVSYRNRFAAWLKGWDYDEEAMEVVSLDPELTDEDWLEAICKIIGISEDELKTSRKKEEDATKQEKKEKEAQTEAEDAPDPIAAERPASTEENGTNGACPKVSRMLTFLSR